MQIKIAITFEMDADQLKNWADKYGLDQSEAASDADKRIRSLVQEHIEQMFQMTDFTTIKRFN